MLFGDQWLDTLLILSVNHLRMSEMKSPVQQYTHPHLHTLRIRNSSTTCVNIFVYYKRRWSLQCKPQEIGSWIWGHQSLLIMGAISYFPLCHFPHHCDCQSDGSSAHQSGLPLLYQQRYIVWYILNINSKSVLYQEGHFLPQVHFPGLWNLWAIIIQCLEVLEATFQLLL